VHNESARFSKCFFIPGDTTTFASTTTQVVTTYEPTTSIITTRPATTAFTAERGTTTINYTTRMMVFTDPPESTTHQTTTIFDLQTSTW